MYNDLLTIGPLTIHGYGLMTAIGIIAAYFSAEYRAKKKGLQPERILALWSGVWSGLSVFQAAVYYYDIAGADCQSGYIPQLSGRRLGGLRRNPGRILGGWLYCRWKKLETWKYFDLGLASVALAQGFGRIGCFLAGCCYGAETSGPLAVVFPDTCQYAPPGVPLVPTQLISSALDFLLFFFLILYDRKWKKRDGEVTAWYLILYSAGRFILEFWRGDAIRGAVGPLSTSQFIGIFTFLAGIILLALRRKSSPARRRMLKRNRQKPGRRKLRKNRQKPKRQKPRKSRAERKKS